MLIKLPASKMPNNVKQFYFIKKIKKNLVCVCDLAKNDPSSLVMILGYNNKVKDDQIKKYIKLKNFQFDHLD